MSEREQQDRRKSSLVVSRFKTGGLLKASGHYGCFGDHGEVLKLKGIEPERGAAG